MTKCKTCDGTGRETTRGMIAVKYGLSNCPDCKGTGLVEEQKHIIEIPDNCIDCILNFRQYCRLYRQEISVADLEEDENPFKFKLKICKAKRIEVICGEQNNSEEK